MKTIKITSIITFLLIAFTLSQSQAQEAQQQAEETIQDWPETAQKAAKETIDKYGEPDEQNSSLLVWYDNGDWSKTVVQREEIDHQFPMPHKDVLYQEIEYQVPPEMFSKIAQYDGSVITERTKGTIAARCDKEGANYLAINLAHEIIEGEKSLEEARQFYAKTMKQMMQGESSEYLEGFVFDMPQGDTGDPGTAMMDKN